MKPAALFSEQEQSQIVEAIRRAERSSSIEVRVHVENHCPGEVLDHAVAVFEQLGMRSTGGRNGILLYVALKDRMSAIIGDENVNRYVRRNFWQETAGAMNSSFSHSEFAVGICDAIDRIQKELKDHFPCGPGDSNELPDEVSFGG